MWRFRSADDVDPERRGQLTWLVKQVTGDENGTLQNAFDYGEVEYSLLEIQDVIFHVYQFSVGR